MREGQSYNTGGLNPLYQTYEHQKCFIGLSHGASWRPEIVKACEDVLPSFELEPWYADTYHDPARLYLLDIVVAMIANARYGIYDLSYWRKNDKSEWEMPRNVFIELGIAIGLNRPMLLLQRETSQQKGPKLPECLESIRDRILSFKGPHSLKEALMKHLPDWVHVPPDQEWINRYCHFGGRACTYRDRHPHWLQGSMPCHVAYDQNTEFRRTIEEVLHDYSNIKISYLNELSIAENYEFLLCSYCQTVRSTPFAIYYITPDTPGETFIAIGISIALEKIFNHNVPKILFTTDIDHVPSLLQGYKVAVANDYTEVTRLLYEFLPEVYNVVRKASWKSRPLPFIEILPRPRPKLHADEGISSETDNSEAQTNQAPMSEAQTYIQQGDLLYSLQKYEEALSAYEQAISLTPGDPALHYNKGLTLQALKRHDEALSAYEQAIQVKSDYALAYARQGEVYIARNEYQQAISRFDQALALDTTIEWVKAQREEANRLLASQNVVQAPPTNPPASTRNDPASTRVSSPSAPTPYPNYYATTSTQSPGRNLQEKTSTPSSSERRRSLLDFLPRSRSTVQPVQVFKKLEYAMEDKSLHRGEARRLAPEVYDIYLSFKDHQQLDSIKATLLKDWQQQLIDFARQHRYTLRSMPVLRLHPSASMRPGSVRVEAQFADRVQDKDSASSQDTAAEQLEQLRNRISQTGSSSPSASPFTSVPVMPPAWLTIRLPQSPEKVYRIEKPVIKIGKQLDNDIIVEDKRVSRYHAQIKFESNGQFTIYDLGSTNGITVNGTPGMRQHTLRTGDRFTIGSYDFYFERR